MTVGIYPFHSFSRYSADLGRVPGTDHNLPPGRLLDPPESGDAYPGMIRLRWETALSTLELLDGFRDQGLVELARCHSSQHRQPLGVDNQHEAGDPC